LRITVEKDMLTRISKIAIAIAFSFVICGIAVRPALADEHHGGGDARHNERGHADRDRDRRAPQPDYYYAPQPNYYTAPEPDYYYAPQPQYPPAPSEGITLFFGL